MAATAPIELERRIECPRLHAFEVFSARTANWWPRRLSRSGAREFTVALEPWVGGRVYERTSEGDELEWAEVTEWASPRRIGFRWHLHGPREEGTDVEVRFTYEDGSTTVGLTERGFARAGPGREELRERSLAEWELALDHFAAGCIAEPQQKTEEE